MLPSSKAVRGWLRVLWVCAAVAVAVLAVNPGLWHGDGAERHCAVCHISNLPVIQPVAAIHIERPSEVAWHSPAEQVSFNTQSPLVSISGRAPPA